MSGEDEEFLELGGSGRLTRWVSWVLSPRGLVALVAIGIALVVVTVARQPPEPDTVGAAAAPPTTTSLAPSPSDALPSPPFGTGGADSPGREALWFVYERAHDPAVGRDYVREDTATQSCPVVPTGLSPRGRGASLLGSALPNYDVFDRARVFDKSTGLCTLDLRARDRSGTVAVLHVVAPIPDAVVVSPRLDDGSSTGDDMTTQFVRVSTRDGWIVTVGSSGPATDRPVRSRLTALAQRRELLW